MKKTWETMEVESVGRVSDVVLVQSGGYGSGDDDDD